MRRLIAPMSFGLASLMLAGCATHLEESRQVRGSWNAGDFKSVMAETSVLAADKTDTADELVWKLDYALAARTCGNTKESIKTFDEAYAMVSKFDADSEIDLGAESKALVTNLSYLPYTGYNYDRIMMGTYQALNCMQTGDINGAAVMLKRVQNSQEEAERKNAAEIQKDLDKAAKLSGKKVDNESVYDAKRAMRDSKFKQSIYKVYGSDATVATSARGDYVNPFAYWLDGVYFMACARDASDRTRAVDDFRLLTGMTNGRYVVEDLAQAQSIAQGGAMLPTTYVIYFTGNAPLRNQVRIDIPMFLATNEVPYVGINFPKLEYNSNFSPNLNITASGKSYPLETIADMDSIIKREFDDKLPSVIAKTLLSAGTKAAIQYGLQTSVKAAGGNDTAVLIMMIVGSVYQAVMNDADLRTWATLPKQIRIARIPTPTDKKLKINATEILLSNSNVNVVCVTKPSAGSAMSIQAFGLGDKN